MAPLLDPNDIEKRIADLKSVESWLSMNMNVLRMTIQGLEMQKATLAAFQAMQPKSARSRRRPRARARRHRRRHPPQPTPGGRCCSRCRTRRRRRSQTNPKKKGK